LVTNPKDPLVEVQAPPAHPEKLHSSQSGENVGRQRWSVQVRSRVEQPPDFVAIENARLVLRLTLWKLFWLQQAEGVLGHVAAAHSE
jgi:hypothetical protein